MPTKTYILKFSWYSYPAFSYCAQWAVALLFAKTGPYSYLYL